MDRGLIRGVDTCGQLIPPLVDEAVVTVKWRREKAQQGVPEGGEGGGGDVAEHMPGLYQARTHFSTMSLNQGVIFKP